MEDLIEEFLEELIDKNEITANERTDMKLTLLEAMPREMTEETKVRVMSSLKSKMETPSANIFTDKGVNIVAVRTIANESVKEVVKAVEKEEQERAEAEIKRDAKVSEAIDSIILDADKNSEENLNKENDVYESSMFGNISKEAVADKFEMLKWKMGDRHSDETLLRVAEAETAFEEMNQSVAKIMREQNMSQSDAVQIVINNNPGDNEKQTRAMIAVATKNLRKYATKAIEEGKTPTEAIALVLEEHKDEFLIIPNMDETVERCKIFLEKYEKNRRTFKESYFTTLTTLKIQILKVMLSGKSFDEAAALSLNKYDSQFSMIRDVNVLIEDVYNALLNEGYTKEQLENGTITQADIERNAEKQAPSNDEKEESVEAEPQGPSPIPGSKVDHQLPPVINGDIVTTLYLRNIASQQERLAIQCKQKALEMVEQEDEKYLQEIALVYGRKEKNKDSHDNIIQYSKSQSEVLKIVKARDQINLNRIRDIRKIEFSKRNDGTLSENRKNIISKRERFLTKAVKLYLSSGEKSAYDIIEELGKDAEKFEILPNDIIDIVYQKMFYTNRREADIVKKHEEKIITYSKELKAAKIALNNAIKDDDKVKIEELEKEILNLENTIKTSKGITRIQKRTYGSLDMLDNSKEEQNLKENIKDSIDYTNQMEQLKEMQKIYTELRGIKGKDNESFDSIASKYFSSKMLSAKKFGPKLLDVLKQKENDENAKITIKLLESCIQEHNEIYMQTINRNIQSLNKDIELDSNATRDEGFIDTLLEKDRLERELKNAEDRDYILRYGHLSASKVKRYDRKIECIRRAVVEYYSENVNAADLIKKYKDMGITIDINDLLKGIAELAIKSGVDEEKVKVISKNEKEIYRNYIKVDGLNILKDNAVRQSKGFDEKELDQRINLIQRENSIRKEDTTEIRSIVNQKYPNLADKYKYDRKKAREDIGLKTTIKLSQKPLANTGTQKYVITDRIKRVEFKEQRESNVPTKKGIGMMNVAKILETSGTTSQEIVGEVTDLNKIARVQDERGISEEQRDS